MTSCKRWVGSCFKANFLNIRNYDIYTGSFLMRGFKMLIFKPKIIILGFISFATPIRFVLYPSYTNNKETFMKSKYFQKMPKIGKTLQDSFIEHIKK